MSLLVAERTVVGATILATNPELGQSGDPGFVFGFGAIPIPGVLLSQAVSFTIPAYSTLTAVEVPVNSVVGTPAINLSLRVDEGGVPGAIVEDFGVVPIPTELHYLNFVPALSSAHPRLAPAVRYWIVARPADATTFAWWQFVPIRGNSLPYPSATQNHDGPWSLGFSNPPSLPGFRVLGEVDATAIPEPTARIMVPSGIAVLFVIRFLGYISQRRGFRFRQLARVRRSRNDCSR